MSTIDQLKRIDSACVAFEHSWTPTSRLTEQAFLRLAQSFEVQCPEDLLVELLLLDWQQAKAIDSSFQPGQALAEWSNYPEAFGEALLEYQAQEKLAISSTQSASFPSLAAGVLLGPYQIRGRIGTGGMGDVYSAEDTRLGRTVAIKILASHLTQNSAFVKRFAREAATVARLSHPNIVTLFDLGEVEVSGQSVSFVVMEFLEGETLREHLENGKMPIHRAIHVAMEIADALDATHRQSVVHRDIKPENIFLTADGRVKILDFGLARLGEESFADKEHAASALVQTQVGAVLGTSGYMSPEQVRGESATAASDLFSLTCVLYEMLIGQRAFQGDSRADMATATLRDDPLDLLDDLASSQLPSALLELMHLGLQKHSQTRIQSAEEYSRRLGMISADVVNAQLVRTEVVHSHFHSLKEPFSWSLKSSFISAVLFLLVLAATAVNYRLLGSTLVTTETPQTIAVLPFSSKSDLDSGSVARSLTLALTDTLAKDELFCVRPYTAVSTWNWEGTSNLLDDPRIDRLKADLLVTGQVTVENSMIHVRVELVNVAAGRLSWSHNYSSSREMITNLQNAIRSDVLKQLGGKPLSCADSASLALAQ